MELLGVSGRPRAISALRQTLIQAIESLRPEADIPAHSHLWRVYEILLYRYVQQCGQKEVADQLGISVRHLRREQRDALEVLAQRLYEQFDLESQLVGGQEEEGGSIQAQAGDGTSAVNHELAWLKEPPTEDPVNLGQALPAALELARPIAEQHGVHLYSAPVPEVPALAIHPVALRQILLSLLSMAIRKISTGRVDVSVREIEWGVEIHVRSQGLGGQFAQEDDPGIDILRQLVSTCGGRLVPSANERCFALTVSLPGAEQVPVLVIDDNEDTLRLLQRYAVGTRYRIVGTTDPEGAFSLVGQVCPQIIVLDVMMPDVDGWEVLGRLAQHPLTNHIPVAVCTILPERELALSLGASGFAQKPVSRESFLSLLDRQVQPMEPKYD